MSKEAIRQALDFLRSGHFTYPTKIATDLEEALAKQEQGEPVALKKGECWPEEVMQQWDYWRKEIANGHKGSAPRDWFEGLSELKLIDTTLQQRKPMTDEQKKNIFLKFYGKHWAYTKQIKDVMEAVEDAHGIKE